MIQTKYIIMIGVLICLLIIYYFYNEINSVKKLYMPTYRKTMDIEAKLIELQNNRQSYCTRPVIQNQHQNQTKKQNDSPIFSITYQSDMVKNGNVSVKYAEVSDTEANKIIHNVKQNNLPQFENNTKSNININNKNNILPEHKKSIPLGDFSDNILAGTTNFNNGSVCMTNGQPNSNTNENYTDTFNVKISELVKPKNNGENEFDEFQQILAGLEKKNEIISDELDSDIIKKHIRINKICRYE